MTTAAQYREKAAEFLLLAHGETSARLHLEYTAMAQRYLRLADLADQNSRNDVVYETPKRSSSSCAIFALGMVILTNALADWFASISN